MVGWIFGRNHQNRMNDNTKPLLLSENEARRRIQALPVGTEPRIKWAGYELPGEIAEGHFLTVGVPGTGKTLMHRELMRSVLPSILPGSDRRAVIYDVKSSVLSELFSMKPSSEVIVFNPLDKRSVAWDLAADVKTPKQVRDFTKALIPSGNSEASPFFTDAACAIVAEVADSLNRTHPGNWDFRRLILLSSNRPKLERVLAGSDLFHGYVSDAHTFANIQCAIVTRMAEFEPIAALWRHAKRKISLQQWAATGDSILVFGDNLNLRFSLPLINCHAFKMVSSELLSEPDSLRLSRLWFFCDDLRAAGLLDLLPALLHRGRSKGVRCALGFQDIAGLAQLYGNRVVSEEILNSCATVSWLKTICPDTAEWASKLSGNVLLPLEFLELPASVSGNVHGVHMIKDLGGIFKASAHYELPKSGTLDFDPRPESEKFLEPWGPDDDEWLDAGK